MEPLGSPINVERAVTVVAFTPSGQVATGEDDSTVRIWDAISREPVGAPIRGIGPITNLTFSGDGGTLAAWGGGRELKLWNTQTSQPIGDPLKTNADMTAVAVSFDGHMVAAGSQDGVIKLWDTRDGTAHPQLTGENAKVTTLEFNSAGTRLLSASANGTVRVWPIDVPKPDALCAKLSENMSLEEWADVVSPEIEYRDVCDGLPRGEPTA